MKRVLFLFTLFGTTVLHAGSWQFGVAPYLWGSGLHGTVQLADKKVHVSETFVDLIKHLDFGMMVAVTANKENVGLFVNGLYTKVSADKIFDRIRVGFDGKMTILSGGASYRFFADSPAYVEPYVGARYTANNTTLTFDSLPASKIERWTDAIIGTRINYLLTPVFNLEFAADYGQGTDSSSYNYSAFMGYQSPTHFKNTRFYLGYRVLHQNYQNGHGINLFKWNMNILGPIAGMLVKF